MTTATEPTVREPVAPRGRGGLLAVVIAIVVLVAAGGWYWWARVQTYHFETVVNTILYRDGFRDLREFDHGIHKAGIRTVVSLIDAQELADPAKPQFADEEAYCLKHGIRLVRIPVRLGGWPTSDQITQFLTIVQDPANRPVLVHCAQGVRRTGMFVAAYQLEVQEWIKPRVKSKILSFGHKPRDTDDVRTFIDRYDPATATLPATMPVANPD